MRNLLSAGFHRLVHYRLFWITLIGYMFVCCSGVIDNYHVSKNLAEDISVDGSLFNMLPVIGFFLAVLISVFLGDEFRGGTIRNKMIAGYSRIKVYCSSLIVMVIAAIIELLAGYLVSLILGYVLSDSGYAMSGKQLLMLMLLSIFVVVTYSALFVAITLVIGNRTASIAACLLVTGVMLFAAILITSRLEEPEKISDMMVTANGIEQGPERDNPLYVEGSARKAMIAILRILPTGQTMSICSQEGNYGFLGYSGMVILVLTVLGSSVFYRRDIQ